MILDDDYDDDDDGDDSDDDGYAEELIFLFDGFVCWCMLLYIGDGCCVWAFCWDIVIVVSVVS